MGRTMEAVGEEAEISVPWLVGNDLRCEDPPHKAPTAGVGQCRGMELGNLRGWRAKQSTLLLVATAVIQT